MSGMDRRIMELFATTSAFSEQSRSACKAALDDIAILTAQRDALLKACQAMLEPFGIRTHKTDRKELYTCQVCLCEWSNPIRHTTNCPVPIAEAAIALATTANGPGEGEQDDS